MTPEAFIAALADDCLDGSVRDVLAGLAHPPGRRPSAAAQALAQWYAALPAADRARVEQVVRQGAHGALFGVLAILDGVRRVDPANGSFELTHVAPDGARTPLTPPAHGEPFLHDHFQARVYASVFGEPAA